MLVRGCSPKVSRWFFAVFALALAPLGCTTKTGTEGKIVVTINLGANFDTAAITGLVLMLDAPGDAGLNLTAQAAQQQTKSGHTYTSEVKDCDADGRNEFCVTFAENPFSAATYSFTFSGAWSESVLLSLRVIVQLQGGKQETATKEQFDDTSSLRFVSGQSKTVTVSIPCRVGYSCAGTIDTTPPAAPVGTGVTPQGPANNNSPVVAGTAEANTTIQIFSGDATCTATPTTGTVNDAGQFAVTVAVQDNTSTVFFGRVVDLGENVGLCAALNATVPYVEDSTIATPGAPDLLTASDTGLLVADDTTNDSTPTFTGTIEGFAMVSLYHDGGTLVGTASTTSDGLYSVTSSTLADGIYAFTVRAQDDAGNVSDASVALTVTIDTTPPSAPTSAPDLAAASDTGMLSTDNVTGDTTPTFSGTVEANATVTLFKDGTPVGTATANDAGGYSVTSSEISEGDHAFAVKQTDIAGNGSDASASLVVTIDPMVDCPQARSLFLNGPVYAIARSGCTLYLGGNFTMVGPPTGAGAALSGSTGQLALQSPLTVNAEILAVTSDDAGGWYIGGYFSSVGDAGRNGLARINADGTLHPWNPNAENYVAALALSQGVVYAGGAFIMMGGQTRNYLAAVDADGGVLAWNPSADGVVSALAVSGNSIYLGGAFTTIDGGTRNYLAAIDTDGGLLPWNPNAGGPVNALALRGSTIYAGGYFTTIGGQARNYIAAIDADGGLVAWNPGANSNVDAIVVAGETVYAGGAFSTFGGLARVSLAAVDFDGGPVALGSGTNGYVNALAVSESTVYAGGSFSKTGLNEERNNLAAFDRDGGGILAWDPSPNSAVKALAVTGATVYAGGSFTSIGGQPRNNLAAIDLDAGLLAWNPKANGSVFALAVGGGAVYAGGSFTTIDGGTRNRLAAIDFDGGTLPWNPGASSSVLTLAVSGTTIYAGGYFTAIGGQTRNYLAAIDTDGGLLSWNPSPNNLVRALTVGGGAIYAGGDFTSILSQTRNRLAAIEGSGGLLAWDPNANNAVYSLAVSGEVVYVGGNFNTLVGQSRSGLARLGTDGTLHAWNPIANNIVRALAVSGGVIYAGGDFTTIDGGTRNRLAAFATDGGQRLSWNPNANGTVNALIASTVTVYAGGSFTTIGGASQTYLAPIDAITGLLE